MIEIFVSMESKYFKRITATQVWCTNPHHCLGEGDRDRLGGVLADRGGGDPRRTGDRDILLDAALGDLLLDLEYRGTAALLGGGDLGLDEKKEKLN